MKQYFNLLFSKAQNCKVIGLLIRRKGTITTFFKMSGNISS